MDISKFAVLLFLFLSNISYAWIPIEYYGQYYESDGEPSMAARIFRENYANTIIIHPNATYYAVHIHAAAGITNAYDIFDHISNTIEIDTIPQYSYSEKTKEGTLEINFDLDLGEKDVDFVTGDYVVISVFGNMPLSRQYSKYHMEVIKVEVNNQEYKIERYLEDYYLIKIPADKIEYTGSNEIKVYLKKTDDISRSGEVCYLSSNQECPADCEMCIIIDSVIEDSDWMSKNIVVGLHGLYPPQPEISLSNVHVCPSGSEANGGYIMKIKKLRESELKTLIFTHDEKLSGTYACPYMEEMLSCRSGTFGSIETDAGSVMKIDLSCYEVGEENYISFSERVSGDLEDLNETEIEVYFNGPYSTRVLEVVKESQCDITYYNATFSGEVIGWQHCTIWDTSESTEISFVDDLVEKIKNLIIDFFSFISDLITNIFSFTQTSQKPEIPTNKTSFKSQCGHISHGHFIIATSFNRLCSEGEDCSYRNSVSELASTLATACYDTNIIDIHLEGTWHNRDEAKIISERIRPQIKEGIGEFEYNTYLLILGDYDIIPPCIYRDDVTSKEGFLFFEAKEHSFLSDDCYGTMGDGPSEIVISRLPTIDEKDSIDYLDKMTEYHLKKTTGRYGLNDDRLREFYLGIPPDRKKFQYFLLSSRDQASQISEYPEIKWYEIPDPGLFSILEDPTVKKKPDSNAYPIQYYMLHGNYRNARWFTIDNVTGTTSQDNPSYPFISVSFACYGGSIYSKYSIPLMWMFNEYEDDGSVAPNAFIGSTDISYFSKIKEIPVGSDILFEKFHEEFENGRTVGNSFLKAKHEVYNYKYDGNFLVGVKDFMSVISGDAKIKMVNDKVALEYQLYGDPLLYKEDMIQVTPAYDYVILGEYE